MRKLLISAVFMMLIIIAPSFTTATNLQEDDEICTIRTKGFIVGYNELDENTVEFYMIIGITTVEGKDIPPQLTNGPTRPGGLKLEEMDHFSLKLNNHFVSLVYKDTFSV